jgi:hypothetical protein
MPQSLPSGWMTGTPETFFSCIRIWASFTVAVGGSVAGRRMMPLALRLTLETSSACCSMERFLWIMPIPPSCANAIAMLASVTVSIGELMRGIRNVIRRVNVALTSTLEGTTSLYCGSRRTSSKVIPISVEREKLSIVFRRGKMLPKL